VSIKRAPKRWRIAADERTKAMPLTVLTCRANGHPWVEVPLTPARKEALMAIGLTELLDVCMRCDLPRVQTYELGTGQQLSSDIDYRKNPDYLVKEKGSGKLSRGEAKKALLVRRMPEFAM